MNETLLEELQACEVQLASATPFGDWKSIINRNLTFYEKGVAILARRSPSLARLADTLKAASVERRFYVFGHPVVRDSLNRLLHQVKNGDEVQLNSDGRIIDAVNEWLTAGSARTNGTTLKLNPHQAIIWQSSSDEDPLQASFLRLFETEIAHSISSHPAVLRDPPPQMIEVLNRGCTLLDLLIPNVARSTLAHVHIVALVDVSDRSKWDRKLRADLCQSVSTHAIPGTIFLSPSVLRTPYHAAEAIFHETGHKKLSDLVFTRSIFRWGYSEKNSPVIRALWNRSLSWNSADWSIDRALFACHVYVHLGLFFATLVERLAELQPIFGPLDGMNPRGSARGAFNRARYLLREIQRHSDEALGHDGKSLVDWLTEILNRLDPHPPVQDPDIHLWLDRYDRETREIASVLSFVKEERADEGSNKVNAEYRDWSARRIADHLVHSEIVSAFRILSVLGETNSETFNFYNAERWSVDSRSGASLTEITAAFTGVRTFLSRTLRNTSESNYSKTCQTRRLKTLKEMVSDTVEHSARHIDDLISVVRHQTRKNPAKPTVKDTVAVDLSYSVQTSDRFAK